MLPTVIKSFKGDGSIHRTWYNVYLIKNESDYFIVGSFQSSILEGNGRKWSANEPAIIIFSKKEWFNVCCMIKDNSVLYYVNLASPAIFEDDVIKYVDYDLDLKFRLDGEIKYLDRNEYKKNSQEMNYDKSINSILQTTISKIKKLMRDHKFPFNDKDILMWYEQFTIKFHQDKK